MSQSIWSDIKREFSYGNMVTRLIIINCMLFVAVNLVLLIIQLGTGWQGGDTFSAIVRWLEISTNWKHNLTRPWVIITHMFLHLDFFHILWNMLLLYWFGRITGDFLGNNRILPIYLLGGLAGAFAFFFLYNIIPALNTGEPVYALGASAAVTAIIIAAAVTSPDYIMYLLFFGGVKLKYIAAVLIFLDLIGVANNINTGGHFAHLGGAAMGWFFVTQLRKGSDWSVPINSIIDRVSQFFSKLTAGSSQNFMDSNYTKRTNSGKSRSTRRTGNRAPNKQARVDAILDKIKQSGYDSLTDEEKEYLFKASEDN